jgi:hypothetical protein
MNSRIKACLQKKYAGLAIGVAQLRMQLKGPKKKARNGDAAGFLFWW